MDEKQNEKSALEFDFGDRVGRLPRIVVFGVGGGGGNAINSMIREKIEGVDFIAGNTDMQALNQNLAETTIQLGKELTKGLGAGSSPEKGRESALESADEITKVLEGADLVFITAGMGGGTGTGASPVIAKIARDLNALTVGVVTRPFSFEGRVRARNADAGINELKSYVDTLVTISNQRLLDVASEDTTVEEGRKMADNVLRDAVQGISELLTKSGTINVDFADIQTVMSNQGVALMGIGRATGPNRAIEAASKAISSPLLDNISIDGATAVLINVTSSTKFTIRELDLAVNEICDAADLEANIIFGHVIDDSMGDEVQVTVVATGFKEEFVEPPPRASLRSRMVNQKAVEPEPRPRMTGQQPAVSHPSADTEGRRARRSLRQTHTFSGVGAGESETMPAATPQQQAHPASRAHPRHVRNTNSARRVPLGRPPVLENYDSLDDDKPAFLRYQSSPGQQPPQSDSDD